MQTLLYVYIVIILGKPSCGLVFLFSAPRRHYWSCWAPLPLGFKRLFIEIGPIISSNILDIEVRYTENGKINSNVKVTFNSINWSNYELDNEVDVECHIHTANIL